LYLSKYLFCVSIWSSIAYLLSLIIIRALASNSYTATPRPYTNQKIPLPFNFYQPKSNDVNEDAYLVFALKKLEERIFLPKNKKERNYKIN